MRLYTRVGALGSAGDIQELLSRPEVQAHLRLTIRQKAELGLSPPPPAGAAATAPSASGIAGPAREAKMQQRMEKLRAALLQGGTENTPQTSNGATPSRPAGSAPTLADAEKSLDRIFGVFETFAGEIVADDEETLKRVLSPEQFTRFEQIRLQWRGPVALADAKIAVRVGLASERRAGIVAIARQAQGQLLQSVTEATAQSSNPASDRKNRLSPLFRATRTAKNTANEKIIALLTPEEAARWKAAQGEPFTFRTDR